MDQGRPSGCCLSAVRKCVAEISSFLASSIYATAHKFTQLPWIFVECLCPGFSWNTEDYQSTRPNSSRKGTGMSCCWTAMMLCPLADCMPWIWAPSQHKPQVPAGLHSLLHPQSIFAATCTSTIPLISQMSCTCSTGTFLSQLSSVPSCEVAMLSAVYDTGLALTELILWSMIVN